MPAFCGSAPVLISTNNSGARPCFSISLAKASQMFGRSTEWIASNRATASFALFDCNGPIRWSARPGCFSFSPGHLALLSCTRFSPNTVCPAAIASSTTSAENVLVTATSVTSPDARPASRQAAAILLFTCAKAAATPAIAERLPRTALYIAAGTRKKARPQRPGFPCDDLIQSNNRAVDTTGPPNPVHAKTVRGTMRAAACSSVGSGGLLPLLHRVGAGLVEKHVVVDPLDPFE